MKIIRTTIQTYLRAAADRLSVSKTDAQARTAIDDARPSSFCVRLKELDCGGSPKELIDVPVKMQMRQESGAFYIAGKNEPVTAAGSIEEVRRLEATKQRHSISVSGPS
jgi:hypothetical protein